MAAFQIFEGLSELEVKHVIDMGMVRSLDPKKLLFRKGDQGHEMYVILKGRIDIIDEYDTRKTVLAELEAGEFFGEMAMFEKTHARSAHALVKEPSRVLVLSEEILNNLFEKKMPKQFLTNIIGVLCRRLRVTNNMYMRAKYGDKDLTWLG
jgi:CRP/FNR family cyclic AMP-dependent transcriptional regulator